MIADIDILFKIAGLHGRMIAGLHDRKIICGKVHIFLFFEHIALRATLPCRCNLVTLLNTDHRNNLYSIQNVEKSESCRANIPALEFKNTGNTNTIPKKWESCHLASINGD